MKTIISHIFNEEYLLPFWLEHHASIFDHGIIIDYYSTDRSVELIRKMCPTWSIVKTKNIKNGVPNFEASLVDREVNEIEKTVQGFKICLNTTEFFVELNKIPLKDVIYRIPIVSMMCTKNNPKNIEEFFQADLFKMRHDRGCRTLHKKTFIHYKPGRHQIHDGQGDSIITYDFVILWCEFYPYNKKFIERKLQIQKNIPERDKKGGYGIQHFTTKEKLNIKYRELLSQHNHM
jgi:hypothetical protein